MTVLLFTDNCRISEVNLIIHRILYRRGLLQYYIGLLEERGNYSSPTTIYHAELQKVSNRIPSVENSELAEV